MLQLDLKPSGQLAVDIRFFDQDPQHSSVRVTTGAKSLPEAAKVPPVNAAPNLSEHLAPSLDVKGQFNGLSYHYPLFSHLNP